MKTITYKNLNMGETIINFLFLLFQQAIFFGFIFIYVYLDYTVYIQKDYKDAGTIILVIHNIVCLVINFFYLRAVKNAIFNFFTYEEYKINEGKLYYEKKLKLFKKNFCFRKLEIDLTDIDSIYILSEKKLIHYRRRKAGLQRYIEYFTPYERIKIKLIDGKEYSVCNYIKKPEYNETYNEAAEAVFQTIANNIKDFIFEEKENYKFQKELVNLEEKYNKEGFRFGEEDKSSTIKVRNIVDDKIYEYILEINFNTKKIIKEKLYITALERKLVFERENNKIVKYDKEIFSEYEITIGFINETLTDSDSVISRIIEWRVPEEIEKYIFYIDKIKINNYSDDLGKYIYENKNNKKLVIEFLKKIGIIVNDIEVYREKNEFFLKNIRESKEFQILSEKEQEKLLSQIAYIYRIHFVYEDKQKQKYKLDYYEQSAGTQKILSMFFPIYNLLNNGGVMIIDELDITLHYSLIKEIIKMFNSVEYNRKNAQLIFTTHNLLLLDFNLFREDQIWFLENNDVSTGTELYSLSDIEGYEKNKYLLRDYLNGNFGGIPKLEDFGVDLWLEKKE